MLEHFIKKSGMHYKKDYRFHPTRKWRFDFAFLDIKIAVEIEGGTYINGRHTRGKGYRNDCEKYNAAAVLGWTVLRYTTDMINDNVLWPLEDIKKILESKKSVDK
jgi:very-short-patch-repair endonuclease